MGMRRAATIAAADLRRSRRARRIEESRWQARTREHEDFPWTIAVVDHPPRKDTPAYGRSRRLMIKLVGTLPDWVLAGDAYEDHHGGAVWVQDAAGWLCLQLPLGIEWSAQFCADPAKVDRLRQYAVAGGRGLSGHAARLHGAGLQGRRPSAHDPDHDRGPGLGLDGLDLQRLAPAAAGRAHRRPPRGRRLPPLPEADRGHRPLPVRRFPALRHRPRGAAGGRGPGRPPRQRRRPRAADRRAPGVAVRPAAGRGRRRPARGRPR